MHFSQVVNPCDAEYVPKGQSVHRNEPTVSEYFPLSHHKQSSAKRPPRVGRYFPASQPTQTAAVAPVDARNVPSAHVMHSPGPTKFLYVPSSQGKHGPPAGPEKPALQLHDEDPGKF
jgi:hypothetical protein